MSTTTTVKTSELSGVALDWTVAEIDNVEIDHIEHKHGSCYLWLPREYGQDMYDLWHPSCDWSQGGEIIEREKINITNNCSAHYPSEKVDWFAEKRHFNRYHKAGRTCGEGTSPLIAAMRCYVASKLGETVEIPLELLK